MTRLFRSKSCGLVGLAEEFSFSFSPAARQSSCYDQEQEKICKIHEKEEHANGHEREEELNKEEYEDSAGGCGNVTYQYGFVDLLVAAMRKSLVTCSVSREDVSALDISYPTEVRHVSHVTFDRFSGFLGLPTDIEPEVPRRVPSASANVFGVSPESMQCSFDNRGNSVPTILIKMQKRLYAEGGLESEGIFRIATENSHEEYVRDQLNRGHVPLGIDVHCLAGLIKAWLRELPTGILDSLTPDQVMNCNTEDDYTQLVNILPQAQAEILDWAVNLMADVVQHEDYNKMNARSIAMVFAPNMTRMADPLNALIHAVQVMNFLKTLILKTIKEREDAAAKSNLSLLCSDCPGKKNDPSQTKAHITTSWEKRVEVSGAEKVAKDLSEIDSDAQDKVWNSQNKNNGNRNFSLFGVRSPKINVKALTTVETG